MYQLFYSPGSAAMTPHVVLEEIGAPYKLIKLDTAARDHDKPEYRRLNPNGRIPTLVDGDFIIYETAAICLYLADKHPEAKLQPLGAGPERGRFLQWLIYLTNTVQVTYMDYFHPEWSLADHAMHPALKAFAVEKLYQQFQIINDGIGQAPFMAGAQFSICDIYLAMLARWSRGLPKPAWSWSNIHRVVDGARIRSAFQRVLQQQGIGWPDNWPKG